MQVRFRTLLILLLLTVLIVSCDESSASETVAVKKYTVSFDSDGGDSVQSQSVEEGKYAKEPSGVTRSDDKYQTVDYWTLDGAEFKFEETPITGNITLKAVWKEYAVGDTGPAGGIIFYDNGNSQNNTWRFLEAAPEDAVADCMGIIQPEVFFGYCRTSGSSTNIQSVTGDNTSIGTGSSNTRALVSSMNRGAYSSPSSSDTYTSAYYAAKVCVNYLGPDYKDWGWFLPSKGELEKLYEARSYITNLYTATSDGKTTKYWSSSEKDSGSAYSIDFSNGETSVEDRGHGGRLRPIRAF